MKSSKQFIFFALAASGQGISGGDRIFIELAKRWSKQYPVTIYLWEEGYQMCKRQGLDPRIKYEVVRSKWLNRFGFLGNYIALIILGIQLGFTISLNNTSKTVIYSASEFLMDSLPCAILKRRFKESTWLASWFQTAPNPLKGFTYGERENTYKMSAFLYWLAQLPIKPLIANTADIVLVNNEDEKKQFPALHLKKKVFVLIGAVDLKKIDAFKKTNKQVKKIYDAVFQGRFHPQKGVLELVEIWRKVVDKRKDAKLVMIGDGPLMEDVKVKIKELGLENNIELPGFVFDGAKKYTLFAQSSIVVHPAFYDSGGMASAEAMAFGLPAVGFNLKSYESYYPKGMVKAKINDINDFTKKVLSLLEDRKKRATIGKEAMDQIYIYYSWDVRAEQLLQII